MAMLLESGHGQGRAWNGIACTHTCTRYRVASPQPFVCDPSPFFRLLLRMEGARVVLGQAMLTLEEKSVVR